jgi:hypothetical protein
VVIHENVVHFPASVLSTFLGSFHTITHVYVEARESGIDCVSKKRRIPIMSLSLMRMLRTPLAFYDAMIVRAMNKPTLRVQAIDLLDATPTSLAAYCKTLARPRNLPPGVPSAEDAYSTSWTHLLAKFEIDTLDTWTSIWMETYCEHASLDGNAVFNLRQNAERGSVLPGIHSYTRVSLLRVPSWHAGVPSNQLAMVPGWPLVPEKRLLGLGYLSTPTAVDAMGIHLTIPDASCIENNSKHWDLMTANAMHVGNMTQIMMAVLFSFHWHPTTRVVNICAELSSTHVSGLPHGLDVSDSIVITLSENPFPIGCAAWARFVQYRKARSIHNFPNLGGLPYDLSYLVSNGHVCQCVVPPYRAMDCTTCSD